MVASNVCPFYLSDHAHVELLLVDLFLVPCSKYNNLNHIAIAELFTIPAHNKCEMFLLFFFYFRNTPCNFLQIFSK